ncbi:hypothetical protein H6G54_00735 [Anabaena cylindrica FACHB-243]|uniref:Uncharacterized protein n=1 Tax=Anabaena cylindrica (strain ATCC 27899 / PCC 7122) TaxID=272123 RepID=K9ZKU7_ANACC|nr:MULTISPECIES: hypothetical protein [Anabaena]AFZ59394.1 hypothetical protein Anacy_4024 [Anabaena cylindrica PCC 7122]MBD2416262.1 hypothetical protein [Anabaena cylindrica FACHB-243]MBY5280225.1 hypothetical protein [Anabaena sp. CCAP 1446/1C]MBY5308497.1 hypothetical protein [Anabaena sp. CCAP 1446/1C]MCM2405312.1 hypothetical protein [Anabaena sp. CCAP 1446/1C]
MTNIPQDEFLLGKRDFMLNSLTLGVAVEIFCKSCGCSPDECLNYLIQHAEKRMAWQTPESIDEFIRQYYIGRQDKTKAIVINFPKPKTA